MLLLVLGGLVCLIGAALAAAGLWLAALGGSWYYILAGATLVATGVLLARRRAAALCRPDSPAAADPAMIMAAVHARARSETLPPWPAPSSYIARAARAARDAVRQF